MNPGGKATERSKLLTRPRCMPTPLHLRISEFRAVPHPAATDNSGTPDPPCNALRAFTSQKQSSIKLRVEDRGKKVPSEQGTHRGLSSGVKNKLRPTSTKPTPKALTRSGTGRNRQFLRRSKPPASKALRFPSSAGIPPLKLLSDSTSLSRLERPPNPAGISPDSLLPDKSNTFSLPRRPNPAGIRPDTAGISPDSLLSDKSKSVKEPNLPNPDGILPENPLPLRSNLSSFPRRPNPAGNPPDRLLPDKSRLVKTDRPPTSAGKAPDKLFPDKSNTSKTERLPTSLGKAPHSLFPDKSSTFKPPRSPITARTTPEIA